MEDVQALQLSYLTPKFISIETIKWPCAATFITGKNLEMIQMSIKTERINNFFILRVTYYIKIKLSQCYKQQHITHKCSVEQK
jgi:hypothetical protein